MHIRSTLCWLLPTACLALLWLGPVATASTGLRATPAWLTLTDTQASIQLTLGNTSDQPLLARVRLYRWLQANGQEQLLPTRDLVVSPPLIEVAPGTQQIVRVVRLQDTASTHEDSYRLIIDQLPRPDIPGHQNLLRYSTPVFASPAMPGAPLLRTRVVLQAGQPQLRIDNAGRSHARLADLAYRDSRGKRVAVAESLAGYVLPGQYRSWPLPARAEGYEGGQFVAKVNLDPRERPLPATPAR